MGAEQNHLWPVIRNSRPPLPIGAGFARATVELARTSEPPCFSVMAMPALMPVFSSIGRLEPS